MLWSFKFDIVLQIQLHLIFFFQHGAQYIYDMDDDNYPDNLNIFDTSDYSGKFLVVDTDNMTFNPYPHFGQESMWPRGFPLELLGAGHHHQYKICTTNRPAIQQGLVNGNPDVDAIFRMTRTKHGEQWKVTFDFTAPAVLVKQGTFAPTNSQNTLYTGKAFWGLVLPTSVSMRACDIYRSYWSQRLLWLSSDAIAFYPPTADQKRNVHSNKLDFRDETDVYKHTEDMLHFLQKWKCTKVFFFDCMTQLAHDMVKSAFWDSPDAELVEAWVSDLANLGYVPPAARKSHTCLGDVLTPVTFHPVEQNATDPYAGYIQPHPQAHVQLTKSFVQDVCSSQNKRTEVSAAQHVYSDVVLIVQIRDVSYIAASEALYRNHFPTILYCGDLPLTPDVKKAVDHWGVSYVHPPHGSGAVPCINIAVEMNYNVNEYLFITDSMLLRVDQLESKLVNLMWMTGDLHVYRPEMVERCAVDIKCRAVSKKTIIDLNSYVNAMKVEDRTKTDLQHCFKKLAANPSKQEEVLHLTDLVVHVPSRAAQVFQEVSTVYLKSDLVDLSFMAVLLLECLEVAPDYLTFVDIRDIHMSEEHFDYVYPFNLKEVGHQGTTENSIFCQTIEKWEVLFIECTTAKFAT